MTPALSVCLVGRAGLGWSEPGPWPRTIGRMADELHRAPQEAPEVAPPYVLVGHSAGGMIARLYCARHREQVAGLMLVDSSHEDQIKRLAQPFLGATRLPGLGQAAWLRAMPQGLARLAKDSRLAAGLAPEAAPTWPPSPLAACGDAPGAPGT